MQTIVGIFGSKDAAQVAIADMIERGIPKDSINFITPQWSSGGSGPELIESQLRKIPTTDAEADGMGESVGALMGGGVGAGAGLAGGAAVASVLVPGVGAIFAIGLGAAALLGLGGAVAGAKIGDAAEHSLDTGVPKDDVAFYRTLLKSGRSLIIVNTHEEKLAQVAQSIIEQRGGEDVAKARREIQAAA